MRTGQLLDLCLLRRWFINSPSTNPPNPAGSLFKSSTIPQHKSLPFNRESCLIAVMPEITYANRAVRDKQRHHPMAALPYFKKMPRFFPPNLFGLINFVRSSFTVKFHSLRANRMCAAKQLLHLHVCCGQLRLILEHVGLGEGGHCFSSCNPTAVFQRCYRA